jgi:hypothetical protein
MLSTVVIRFGVIVGADLVRGRPPLFFCGGAAAAVSIFPEEVPCEVAALALPSLGDARGRGLRGAAVVFEATTFVLLVVEIADDFFRDRVADDEDDEDDEEEDGVLPGMACFRAPMVGADFVRGSPLLDLGPACGDSDLAAAEVKVAIALLMGSLLGRVRGSHFFGIAAGRAVAAEDVGKDEGTIFFLFGTPRICTGSLSGGGEVVFELVFSTLGGARFTTLTKRMKPRVEAFS